MTSLSVWPIAKVDAWGSADPVSSGAGNFAGWDWLSWLCSIIHLCFVQFFSAFTAFPDVYFIKFRRLFYINHCVMNISGSTNSVVSALTKQVKKLPDKLVQSLTWDRGMELAGHKKFTMATDAKVYFCDPQSPWQRGTNENTNRLLRQYFPKKTDLSIYSQAQLDRVAKKLNQRPRKTLDFATPADKLNDGVASTP